MKIIVLLILFGLLFAGCDTALPPQPEENTEFLVLEAYYNEGQTPSFVRVRKSGTYLNQEMVPVENAVVRLKRNRKLPYYPLEPGSGSRGYYYDRSDSFELCSGDVIEIFVYYKAHRLHAETVVPEKPKLKIIGLRDILTVSREKMENSSVIMEMQWQDTIDVEARYFVEISVWDDASKTWEQNQFPPYYVDENRLPLKNKWNFYNYVLYADYVTTSTFSKIMFQVYRINRELTDLYDAVTTKTLYDKSGPSNVEGGKGIFTAIASTGWVQLIEIVP